MNTKNNGILHFITYKEGRKYVAVCLNLNIIIKGNDFEEVKIDVEELASAYLNEIRYERGNDALLNKRAPSKYFEKLKEIKEAVCVVGLNGKTTKKDMDKIKESVSFTSRPYSFSSYCNSVK